MKKIFFILIFFFLPVSGFAATYTVCSSGCDETTIQAIFDNNDLAPGDIVEVQADTVGGTKTYREMVTWGSNDVGDATSQVILKSRSGDTVIISGLDLDDTGTGWSLVSGEYQKAYTTQPYVVVGDSVRLTEGTSGSLNAGEWDWVADVLYLKNNPTSYTVLEVAQRDYGISGEGNYITLNGMYCYGANLDTVSFGAGDGSNDGIMIDKVTAKFNYRVGIRVQGDSCAILRSSVSDGGDHDSGCIVLGHGDNAEVAWNDCSNYDGNGFEINWGSDSNSFHDNTGDDIEDNCLEIYDQSNSNKVYDNYFVNCKDIGIKMSKGSSSNEVHHNIIAGYGTGATKGGGIGLGSGVDAGVFGSGNLIYNNTVTDYTAQTNYPCLKISVAGWKSNIFKNNICVSGASTWQVMSTVDVDNTFDYNLYWRVSGTGLINWNGTTYTIAQWENYKSATGQDAHSPAPSDPLFVNAPGGDFSLLSHSPAISKGFTNSTTLNLSPDIGAFEYRSFRNIPNYIETNQKRRSLQR